MPTIKDIAIRAGVSHGTVSNVLNKKGNVSAEKIQLVEQAAKELGYKINAQAQQLRAGMAKRVCVILPEISTKRYNDFYTGLEPPLREWGFDVDLFCIGQLNYNEKNAVKKALSRGASVVVSVSTLLKNKGLYTAGGHLIFVERKPKNLPEDVAFMTFDYERAGRELAGRCIDKGCRNIALLCGNRNYSNYRAFVNGAVAALDDSNSEYRLFASDDNMSLIDAFAVLNEKDAFDAVIAASEEDIKYLKKASSYCAGRRMPDIYALCSRSMEVMEGVCQYSLNYKLMGRRTAEYIRMYCQAEQSGENSERAAGCVMQMENDGFCSDAPWHSDFCIKQGEEKECIHFLSIQNVTSSAVKLLLPRFQQETGIRVNMVTVAYDELYQMAQACCQSSPYDLIRIDMAWMAELGSRLYRRLSETDEAAARLRGRILPGISAHYSQIGDACYAFPLDACVQMLFYRKDLFENELIKREFFERYKKRLTIPNTYEEYNEIARFFSRKYNPQSPVRFGTTATYGRAFLAGCDFLPRYRASQKSIFDEKGQVRILSEEMFRAVKGYLEACSCADGENHPWWQESTRRFLEGNTAMHIVFSNYASDMLHNSESRIVGKVGYAGVPGGQPLLGGGTVGVSRYSEKYRQCMVFLEWLYRQDIAEMICYMGGYVCSRDLVQNIDIQERYPWIECMEQNFARGWRSYASTQNLQFNEFQFEDILGRAIHAVASGVEGIQEALQKAQNECDSVFSQ